jgi:hypothetical protein
MAPASSTNLDQYANAARAGRLGSGDVSVLEAVGLSDTNYTRSRALLLMNAQQKNDDAGSKRYLDQLMALPENQYNPVFLTDQARWYVNHGNYADALAKAQLAERYWARLPSDLVFSQKAEMYEIEAASWQGRFYQDSSHLDYLDNAIRAWQRYQEHVASSNRTDLQKKAGDALANLESIREKVK